MKQIPLMSRRCELIDYALVDDEDYDYISQWSWRYLCRRRVAYAARFLWNKGNQVKVYMHRVLAKPEGDLVVDHIDGNGLNNQRDNLRVCTHRLNLLNTGRRGHNTSGLKGAFWSKDKKCWESAITFCRKRHFLGRFPTAIEAHEAYVAAGKNLHGEFFHA